MSAIHKSVELTLITWHPERTWTRLLPCVQHKAALGNNMYISKIQVFHGATAPFIPNLVCQPPEMQMVAASPELSANDYSVAPLRASGAATVETSSGKSGEEACAAHGQGEALGRAQGVCERAKGARIEMHEMQMKKW